MMSPREMARRLSLLGARNPDNSFDATWAKINCAVCHDPHSQDHEPFDAAAPADPLAYTSPAGGRHLPLESENSSRIRFQWRGH